MFSLESRIVIKPTKVSIGKKCKKKEKRDTRITYLPADAARQVLHGEAILGPCWWSVSTMGKRPAIIYMYVF